MELTSSQGKKVAAYSRERLIPYNSTVYNILASFNLVSKSFVLGESPKFTSLFWRRYTKVIVNIAFRAFRMTFFRAVNATSELILDSYSVRNVFRQRCEATSATLYYSSRTSNVIIFVHRLALLITPLVRPGDSL